MRVAVLGASVSAQSVHHQTRAVTGYVEVLRRELAGTLGIGELRGFTFAGNRLSDGGLIQAQAVAAWAPDLCIVEPLVEDTSRGQAADELEVSFVYETLLKAGVAPVALFLANAQHPTPNAMPGYALHQRVCQRLGVPVAALDLRNVPERSALFDGVHTTPPGARYVAGVLADALRRQPAGWTARLVAERAPSAPPAVSVTRLPVPARSGVSHLVLRCERDDEGDLGVRVVQPQRIGPHSPVLDLSWEIGAQGEAGRQTQQLSVWDPYCHYERNSYVVLCPRRPLAGREAVVTITRSQSSPDYTRCRRPVEAWPAPQELTLRPTGDLFLVSRGGVRVSLLDYR